MRLRVLALIGLSLVLCAPVLAQSTAPKHSLLAKLRLMDSSPATVRGAGFHAREAVQLTLTVNDFTRVRRTTATASGTFSVAWAGFSLETCAWRLAAVGSDGSRAVLRPRPTACPPPPPIE
jgi:hypothetical protein